MVDPPPASPSWFRTILRSLVLLTLLLALCGFIYENISEARDHRFHPMPGQLIDIGGYRLHLLCSGQGSPAVILDSGLGDSFISWRKVQPEIARLTRACSYDRAGLAYSDSSPHSPTARNLAEELHALLHHSAIPAPVIFVGHSMAGFDARLYASLYRNELAGIVLVDSSHPDQENRFPAALKDMQRSWMHEAEFLSFTMPFGVPRLLNLCHPDPEIRVTQCNFQNARQTVAEIKSFFESATEAASTGSLGDLPLVVLSHDPEKPSPGVPPDLAKPVNDAWSQMQDELAHLSTDSTHTIAKNSGHYIQLDRPDLVIDAVHTLVDQSRVMQPSSSPTSPN